MLRHEINIDYVDLEMQHEAQPRVSNNMAAVIGDVVGSRRFTDRSDLQRILRAGFGEVSAAVHAIQPFSFTIGDEFQGLFATLADAAEATLRLSLIVAGRVGLRYGIGWGPVLTLAPERAPYEQDGPAWWRARQAIEEVGSASRSYGHPSTWRTACVTDGPLQGLLAAHFVLRDQILSGIDQVDGVIALGLIDGETQTALASKLGLDKSAVNRRVGRHGIASLLRSVAVFPRELEW